MKRKTLLFIFCLLSLSGILTAGTTTTLNRNLTGRSQSITNIYPNPVLDKGTITFKLEQESKVLIEFFDLTGRKVKEIDKKVMSSGFHEVVFDSLKMNSGVYLCKISTSEWVEAKRIIISH
jgi:hypothetical protein